MLGAGGLTARSCAVDSIVGGECGGEGVGERIRDTTAVSGRKVMISLAL